jgi:hypothetical protein
MGVRWQLAAFLGVMGAASLGGCVVTVGGTNTANAYDQCNSGEACTGGTTCLQANRTASGFTGFFCTAGCDITSPVCPADPIGTNPVVCVPDDATTTHGQCYLGCNPGQCNPGQTCASDLGSAGPDYCAP